MNEKRQARIDDIWKNLDATLTVLERTLKQAQLAVKERSLGKLIRADFRSVVDQFRDLTVEIRLLDELEKEEK